MKTLFSSIACLAFVVSWSQTAVKEPKFLQDWLPGSVGEYKPDESSSVGTFLQYDGKPYSMATKAYHKEQSVLTIIIFDYKEAAAVIEKSTAGWTDALNQENDEYKMAVITISGFKGWESFSKKTNDAQLYVNLHNRYLLHLSGTYQQSSDYLRKVVQNLQLNKLTK